MYHVPVSRAGYRHLADAVIFIHHIEGSTASTASCHCYRSRRFEGKCSAAAVKHPIQERKYSSAWMCIIYRCTEDKSVCLFRLCHEFIDLVIRKHTAIFITLSTSDTVSHRLTADLKDLVFDALSFQFLSYFQKRLVCIAFFFCTSV